MEITDKNDYSKYLASKDWVSRKERILAISKRWCKCCKKVKATEVHHKTYENVGREKDNELLAVCSNCHRNIHKFHESEGWSLKEATDKYVMFQSYL